MRPGVVHENVGTTNNAITARAAAGDISEHLYSSKSIQWTDCSNTHSMDRLLGARPVGLVLGALVKLRKAIVSFVMSVRMEQLDGF